MKTKQNLGNFEIKSLGCRMPAWKQGHAQIFYLSPYFAARKKMKIMGTPPGLPRQQVNT